MDVNGLPTDKTDEELAHEVQAGNVSSLEILVTRYHSLLLRYVCGMCHDYHLSQDIVQECFVRVISRIGQYRYPEPFSPWIFAIARNLVRDHAKSGSARREFPAGDRLPDDSSSEDAISERWERQAVLEALERLPYTCREVLVLRYYGDLSLEAIARTLEIPAGTVKSRLSRAVHELAKFLESPQKEVEHSAGIPPEKAAQR